VIPKPPFACELSLEREIAEFEALKPGLATLWDTIFPGDDEHYTSVVVPSLTLDIGELAKIPGIAYYEERLLFLLIRLRNPRARMVYVTSQPIHPQVLEYYLQLLSGVPASHALSRLTLVCAHDTSARSLTQKVLERPRLLQRIRYGIQDVSRAYLTVFNSTPLERRLAVLLGIPMNGLDPRLAPLGTKSGSRKLFREAGLAVPEGHEDLRDRLDLAEALHAVRRARPGLRRSVVKLDEGFSGEGNALFEYPGENSLLAINDALQRLRPVEGMSPEEFLHELEQVGGVAEELIDDAEVASPSVQLRVNPRGEEILISTHDQVLGGDTGHVYLGCRFPAADGYRTAIQELGMRVGRALAERGVVSRFGVDFLCHRRSAGAPWQILALELNLRMGGTTHPFLALRFLAGGRLDPTTGLFRSPSGRPKYYRSTDNLCSDDYRGLVPEDLIDILTVQRLHWDATKETGVLFHMMGALSQHGKVGLTAVANSRADAEALFLRTTDILDREAAMGATPQSTAMAGGWR
jgi:hypothetical protein